MTHSNPHGTDDEDRPAGDGPLALVARIWSHAWIRRSVGALLGLGSGAVVGVYLTLAIFVAEARGGEYVFSLDDLAEVRWQLLPTIVGVVSGTLLGWRSLRALARTAFVVVVCALGLVPVGWFGGSALWEGPSAPWAGAVLAAALGLVVGAVVASFAFRGRGAGGGGEA